MVLEAIKYQRGSLEILDQLQLPHKIQYDGVHTSEDSWRAIRDMRVRGAPAIAMVGILGLAIEIDRDLSHCIDSSAEAAKVIAERLDYIVTSRPTAVNLKNMARDFKKLTDDAAGKSSASASGVWEAYLSAAEETLHVDRRDNQRLGDLGAKWIVEQSTSGNTEPITVLTHCNTGSLATAGYGTALGVVRSLHSLGKLRRAYCTETRPYNQGSRLTAFELVHDQIPAMLITDSMAAALLNLKKDSEHIAAIVVGADRVAANGDTANKIGTYALAIAARHHGVKFLVAAPCSTVDLHTASGVDITIEERAASELTSISGPVITSGKLDLDTPAKRVSIAAAGIDVWNPAFDVTPAELIDGIVTEKGVAEKHGAAKFDMAKFVDKS